ncbi:low-density lipoprotein receptor class A domain-containing protein 4-like isoform X2 [Centropristis striata]|uniref:low-density lipoprotein receptor class A domain-containing protein 4-like isoform X2 n=1 Tax=Centropristis striata TaxID=184440 RepID=UPI0027DF2AFC|nr:low-density lipoprotein receptor class A domain-containing protein 4-like isoform X2 [Centropristis striata]
MQNLTAPGGPGNSNVTCSCNCTASQPQGMEISELEFVQIVIIIVVMTVMVVVIICLLNHYKLSTWSFITRQSQAHRHDHTLQQDGCLWPSDSSSRQGASEDPLSIGLCGYSGWSPMNERPLTTKHRPNHTDPDRQKVLYTPQARDRFTAPSFMQRDRFSRFQPTYPYLQHQIDLPPTISLSDGEEPPPYQGPCTLQLRDPEQQMELNRESVRAPPNRTIYDSDLIDIGGGGSLGGVGGGGAGMGGGGPKPPSSNSGISVANSSSHRRMEGPPPAYSEVMGHYPGSAFFQHQHSNNQRVGGLGSRTIQQQSQSESTIVPAKAKDGQPEDLV